MTFKDREAGRKYMEVYNRLVNEQYNKRCWKYDNPILAGLSKEFIDSFNIGLKGLIEDEVSHKLFEEGW